MAYRAYDAFGLIGSEKNGIALLNEDDRTVVLDEHMRHSSGYSMSELKLRKEIERISGLSPSELKDFISESDRSRYVHLLED